MEPWAWAAVGMVLAAAFMWTGKYVVKAIAGAVVDDIGDALQERWETAIDERLAPIKDELTTNGGSSVKDRVNDMWLRFGNVEQQLEQLNATREAK